MKVQIKDLVPGYYLEALNEEFDQWITVQVLKTENGRVHLRDEDGPGKGDTYHTSIVSLTDDKYYKPIDQ